MPFGLNIFFTKELPALIKKYQSANITTRSGGVCQGFALAACYDILKAEHIIKQLLFGDDEAAFYLRAETYQFITHLKYQNIYFKRMEIIFQQMSQISEQIQKNNQKNQRGEIDIFQTIEQNNQPPTQKSKIVNIADSVRDGLNYVFNGVSTLGSITANHIKPALVLPFTPLWRSSKEEDSSYEAQDQQRGKRRKHS